MLTLATALAFAQDAADRPERRYQAPSVHLHVGMGAAAHVAERHPWGPEAELMLELRGRKASFLFGFGGGLADDGHRVDTRVALHFLRWRSLSFGASASMGFVRTREDYDPDWWQPSPYLRPSARVQLQVGPAWIAVDPGIRLMQIIDYDYGYLGFQPGVSARIGICLPP